MLKRFLKNLLIFVLAAFFIVYFSIQVKNIFIDVMETEYATVATIDNTIDLKCYTVRDESLIKSDERGTYNYVVSDGEKLSSGQIIANIYASDSEYEIQEQIQSINSKIETLEESSVEHNYFTLNVSKIDSDLNSIFLNYRKQVTKGDLSLAIQNKKEILVTLNKRYLVVNALTGFENQILEYQQTKDALVNRSKKNVGSIRSDSTGYFYSDVDGYEEILTPGLIEAGTVDEIVIALEGAPKSTSGVVGKIVNDFEWYTVCIVDKDTSMNFSSGSYYEISYPYSVGETIKSVLKNKIVKSDSSDVVLVFETAVNPDSFNFMRNQIIEVKLNSYTGLKVKKEALRIVDGYEGVYILDGNTVRFKRAKKLYENDGYYLISQDDPDSDGESGFGYLEMYDAVINNGKELYDGKTIG